MSRWTLKSAVPPGAKPLEVARSVPTYAPLSMQGWVDTFVYNNNQYPLYGTSTSWSQNQRLESIRDNFQGYTGSGFMSNAVVFACVQARMQVFAQARFQFRELRQGRPGDFFGTTDLAVLEQPEPGKTTSDLLSRMEADVSLGGNSYLVRDGNRVYRLRPDWTAIHLDGDPDSPDAEVDAYVYFPGGPHSGKDPVVYMRDEVAHYAPIPDPLAKYRGMSWITPIVREIMADSGFRDHKINFLEHGGTHNFLFRIDPNSMTKDQFKEWTQAYRAQHENPNGAYQSIFLRAAVDATPLGANFVQSDLKAVIGAGETRIAAAAGVPPIVVGLSEGLEAATYSNYSQARRRFVDGTMRWLWQNAAASLQTLVPAPPGSHLWYDDRDIPALQEDAKDRAEVQSLQATAIKALSEAGYTTDSVVDAITSGDLKRLQHSGMMSVQLQKPGTPNGNGNMPANMPEGLPQP